MLLVIVNYITVMASNGFAAYSRRMCVRVRELALTGGKASLAHLLLLILENTIPGRTATVNLDDESVRF